MSETNQTVIKTRNPQMKALLTAMSRNPGKSSAELRELIGPDVVLHLPQRLHQLVVERSADKQLRDGVYVYFITERGIKKLDEPDEQLEQMQTKSVGSTADQGAPANFVNSVFELGRNTGLFNNAPSADVAQENSRSGTRQMKEGHDSNQVLSQLGKATADGLGWVEGSIDVAGTIAQAKAPRPSNFKQWLGQEAQAGTGDEKGPRKGKRRIVSQPAPDPLEGFRVAVFDDGTLVIEIDGERKELKPIQTRRLCAYLDLVRRTGSYAGR